LLGLHLSCRSTPTPTVTHGLHFLCGHGGREIHPTPPCPAPSHKGVARPLLAAIAALSERLPPLPPLLPGQVLALLDPSLPLRASSSGYGHSGACSGGVSGIDATGTSGTSGTALSASVVSDAGWAAPPGLTPGGWAAWAAALVCLRRLKPEQAAALTAVTVPGATGSGAAAAGLVGGVGAAAPAGDSEAGLLRCQLRCLLVLAGLLSWRELTPARGALINAPVPLLGPEPGPAAVALQAAASGLAALLPLAAAAACCAPQAAQAQLLQEALQAAPLARCAGNALALAAAMVAAWAAAGAARRRGGGRAAEAGAAFTVAQAEAALFSPAAGSGAWGPLLALPHTLPALAGAAEWGGSADAIAAGLLASSRLPGVPASAAAAAAAGALSLRQQLRGGSWEALAAEVAAMT
jgi:hypothetical protein